MPDTNLPPTDRDGGPPAVDPPTDRDGGPPTVDPPRERNGAGPVPPDDTAPPDDTVRPDGTLRMLRPVPPSRLRRRLTVAFVLVAGVATGVLAVGVYLLVGQARLADSRDAAGVDARYQLVLAGDFLPLDETGTGAGEDGSSTDGARSPLDERRDSLLTSFEQTGHHVVLVTGDRVDASSPELDVTPGSELRAKAARGDLGYQRLDTGGRHLLLVGGRIPGATGERPAELYVVTVEDTIYADLDQLRTVLAGGWLAVVVVSALVGAVLARRTLGPVARASAAAQSVAEGLLDTRLPAGGADEFGAWAASFNQMADALQAKITALSAAQAREQRFTADVAHELRTPVTALVAEASLLHEYRDDLPDSARRPVELVVSDIYRLRHLVEELMEISRLDAGREPVVVRPVEVKALLRAILAARGWRHQVRLDGHAATVDTDPRRLERILANVIANAIEHGGSSVVVHIATTADRVQVQIADRGPGIPADHLPNLFDRFYKADPSRASGGSGLGLAIAKENARLLGAELRVHSAVGVGTEFELVLPVARP